MTNARFDASLVGIAAVAIVAIPFAAKPAARGKRRGLASGGHV